MVAVATRATSSKYDASVAAYNAVSVTRTSSYRVQGASIITPIWTHHEYLRFGTVKPGSIIIWEVPFTLTSAPAEVESLPAPDGVADGGFFLFLPALSRLAFVFQGVVSVWDARTSRFLLKSRPDQTPQGNKASDLPTFSYGCSFSSDGRFFACMTVDREVYVWKESPTGYLLHQTLAFSKTLTGARPLLSPNGESIIAFIPPKIHLWPTKDHIPPDPTIRTRSFILEFSPDEKLVAFARERGWVITILDLQSGGPRLVINAGMEVYGLGVSGDTVVAVGSREMVTWNIPEENCTLDAKANVGDRANTTKFSTKFPHVTGASISPDLSRVVIVGTWSSVVSYEWVIYERSTGKELVSLSTRCEGVARFTRAGRQLWVLPRYYSPVEGWKIVEDSESGRAKLESVAPTMCPPGIFPSQSTRGYKVTDDGWLFSPTQKRLLWLPHHWRSAEEDRAWSGRFLGLLHGPPEVVILEFLE